MHVVRVVVPATPWSLTPHPPTDRHRRRPRPAEPRSAWRVGRSARVVALATAGMLGRIHQVAAAEPSPMILEGGDVRTAEIPRLTGGPVEALLTVVVIGVVTAALTVGWQLLMRRGARGGRGHR